MARNNSTKKPILSGVPEGADKNGFKHGRYTVEAICTVTIQCLSLRKVLSLLRSSSAAHEGMAEPFKL
jgi:hypothetical protein